MAHFNGHVAFRGTQIPLFIHPGVYLGSFQPLDLTKMVGTPFNNSFGESPWNINLELEFGESRSSLCSLLVGV